MSEIHLVLARKYRPQTFSELIGQDVMVKVLTNSFSSGRISHSFILTGLRGIGKTTTARIIAKGLNCVGSDGYGKVTTEPCGKCSFCIEISDGRNVDVLEVDAASRTGVNDIRELIDGVNYNPASARYKIYIIDEVHMLSTSAFNALLKTLEEPPEHVKFIFATTETHKIPSTIMSRCQRFDLKRINNADMLNHLKKVIEIEDYKISDECLGLIIKYAEGSMRDSLSILEQVLSGKEKTITLTEVRNILGLNDKTKIIELFENIVKGNTKKSLDIANKLYWDGGDPETIVKELTDIVHLLTILKISSEAIKSYFFSEQEIDYFLKLSQSLSIRVLSRLWQLLNKLVDEMSTSSDSLMALEMGIVRITHISELPTPEELILKIENSNLNYDENEKKFNETSRKNFENIENSFLQNEKSNFFHQNEEELSSLNDQPPLELHEVVEFMKDEKELNFLKIEDNKIFYKSDFQLKKEKLKELELLINKKYNNNYRLVEVLLNENESLKEKKILNEINNVFPGSKIENQ